MKYRSRIVTPSLGAALGLLLAVSAVATDTLQKHFTVRPGGKLTLDADRGDVEIRTGTSDTLDVTVERDVRRASESKARDILAQHEVTFSQDDNAVLVRARLKSSWKTWSWRGPNLEVHFRITVPKNFNVDLTTAGGRLTVADLTGAVRAQTSGGDVVLAHIDGTVWGRTSGGNVSLESATGTVEARTSGGNIRVGQARAAMTAETSGGTITVREARGPAQLSTSGGDIHIDAVYAGIHATTSGGNVEAAFPASPTADATLHTSGGNVTVRLPASASATVDLRTSGGHVKSDLPVTVQGEQKHSTLVGRIGDGGRLIKAGTSGGNVNLLRASAGSS